MRIDIHLQSGDVSVYWLWLLLDVSAVSVVIVIIAICDMPRQEFSLCVRVFIHDMYIAPWEEEGHKCKNSISGTLAIKALNEASKVNF